MNKKKVYSWIILKEEYLLGDERRATAFIKRKGIPKDTGTKHTKGWQKEWDEQRRKEAEVARRLMTIRNAKAANEAIEKHINIAKLMQQFGLKNIAKQNPDTKNFTEAKETKDISSAIRSLVAGISLERKLLGLEKSEDGAASGKVTVNNLIQNKSDGTISDAERKMLQEMIVSWQKYGFIDKTGRRIVKYKAEKQEKEDGNGGKAGR